MCLKNPYLTIIVICVIINMLIVYAVVVKREGKCMKNIEKDQKGCNASAMQKASEELESFAFKLEETREKSFMLKNIVKMVEELENGQNDYAVSNMAKLVFNELNKDLFEECDELENIMIEIDEYLGLLPSDLSEKIS